MSYNPGYVDGVLVANNAAYTPGVGLFKILDNMESGVAYWIYVTSDPVAAVQAAGYVTDATFKRLKLGDIVDVFSGTLLNEAAATPVGVKLGAVTFPATIGVSSMFSAAPQYARLMVTAVTAGTTTTSGTATLGYAEPPISSLLSNPRNMLDGGDATTNPWQRGTSITAIVATNTYTADRWFCVAGAASSAGVVQTADTTVAGFTKSFVVTRASGGASVSSIFFGQAVESLDSIRAQGQPVTLSFWARTMSGYTGGALGVQVTQGFGTDQSASSLVNATWTSALNVVSSTQVLTSTMTRYQFTGNVSITATQLGALFNFTPVGTNTGNDGIAINGIQLEMGGGVTPFEHREIEQELAYCQRYYFQSNEASTAIVALGAVQAANATTFWLALPVQMRAAPTVTVVAGSFAQQVSGTTAAVSGFAAGATHTQNYISVVSTTTATAGLAAMLVSRQTNSGNIAASADL
jgi:hypothetical protein